MWLYISITLPNYVKRLKLKLKVDSEKKWESSKYQSTGRKSTSERKRKSPESQSPTSPLTCTTPQIKNLSAKKKWDAKKKKSRKRSKRNKPRPNADKRRWTLKNDKSILLVSIYSIFSSYFIFLNFPSHNLS